MKKTFALCLLSVIIFTSHAQQPAVADCNCPTPKAGKFLNFCTLVENQDIGYKEKLLQMSCVDIIKDSPETIKAKVQCMWKKYYAEFGCDNTGFLVPQGNILKYAVNKEFELFIDGVVEDFGLDINIKDPADGKTLLDFVLDEVKRYKKSPYQDKSIELQRIYDHFKFDLYALHANELTSIPNYQSGVKVSLAPDVVKRYPGKYSLQLDTAHFIYSIVLENEKLFLTINNGKSSEINAEAETVFFIKPKSMYRYIFNINEKTGKYDLTIKYGTIKNKTKRIE